MTENFLDTYTNKASEVKCPHCKEEFMIMYKFKIQANGYIPMTKEELKAFIGED